MAETIGQAARPTAAPSTASENRGRWTKWIYVSILSVTAIFIDGVGLIRTDDTWPSNLLFWGLFVGGPVAGYAAWLLHRSVRNVVRRLSGRTHRRPWLPLAGIILSLTALISGAWTQTRTVQPPDLLTTEFAQQRAAEQGELLEKVDDLIERWIASESVKGNSKRKLGWEAQSAVDFYGGLLQFTTGGTEATAREMAADQLAGKYGALPNNRPPQEPGYVGMRRRLLWEGLRIIDPLRLRALTPPQELASRSSPLRAPAIAVLTFVLASMVSYFILVWKARRDKTYVFLRSLCLRTIRALSAFIQRSLWMLIFLHLGFGALGPEGGPMGGSKPARCFNTEEQEQLLLKGNPVTWMSLGAKGAQVRELLRAREKLRALRIPTDVGFLQKELTGATLRDIQKILMRAVPKLYLPLTAEEDSKLLSKILAADADKLRRFLVDARRSAGLPALVDSVLKDFQSQYKAHVSIISRGLKTRSSQLFDLEYVLPYGNLSILARYLSLPPRPRQPEGDKPPQPASEMSFEKMIEMTIKAVEASKFDTQIKSDRIFILGRLSGSAQDLPNALADARRRSQTSALDGIVLTLALYAAGEPAEALKIITGVATQFKRFMLENPFAGTFQSWLIDATERSSVEKRSA